MPQPTAEEVAALQQQEAEQPTTPQFAPQNQPDGGDDAAKLKEELEKTNARLEELRKAYNKRDTEITELREKAKSTKGEDDVSYIKGLGFLSKEEMEAEIERREQAKETQVREEARQKSIRERAETIKKDMETIKKDEKHAFVNEDDLLDFMKSKPGLSVMEAAKLKYEDQFDKLKTIGNRQPLETDSPGKGGMEPSEPRKRVTFRNRIKLSDSIRETSRNAAEIK